MVAGLGVPIFRVFTVSRDLTAIVMLMVES